MGNQILVCWQMVFGGLDHHGGITHGCELLCGMLSMDVNLDTFVSLETARTHTHARTPDSCSCSPAACVSGDAAGFFAGCLVLNVVKNDVKYCINSCQTCKVSPKIPEASLLSVIS